MAILSDVEELRARARTGIEAGAITDEYDANRTEVVDTLKVVLASEIMCQLRYKRHYYTATGINSEAVKMEFLEHAAEAQQHADRVAERIAVEAYSEIVRALGTKDVTTRELMTEILMVEEQHARDMQRLLGRLRATAGSAKA